MRPLGPKLKALQMTNPPNPAAETLIETLSDLAATANTVADDLDGDDADHVRHLAKVADECARIAAILNMQRESTEAGFGKRIVELEAALVSRVGGGDA